MNGCEIAASVHVQGTARQIRSRMSCAHKQRTSCVRSHALPGSQTGLNMVSNRTLSILQVPQRSGNASSASSARPPRCASWMACISGASTAAAAHICTAPNSGTSGAGTPSERSKWSAERAAGCGGRTCAAPAELERQWQQHARRVRRRDACIATTCIVGCRRHQQQHAHVGTQRKACAAVDDAAAGKPAAACNTSRGRQRARDEVSTMWEAAAAAVRCLPRLLARRCSTHPATPERLRTATLPAKAATCTLQGWVTSAVAHMTMCIDPQQCCSCLGARAPL